MTSGEIVLNGIFYLFALLAVAGALAVALSKNIVRSAFALLAVLFSAAALYAVMKADFLVAAQILLYVGGILVLILFAIMLTHKITDVKLSNESAPGPVPFFAVLCVLFTLGVLILHYPGWKTIDLTDAALEAKYRALGADSLTQALGRGMMNEYLLPFEIVSMLLLAALVGAAYLARKEVRE